MKKLQQREIKDQHTIKLSNCLIMCKGGKAQDQALLFETITKKASTLNASSTLNTKDTKHTFNSKDTKDIDYST
jgi:hypothetical protein